MPQYRAFSAALQADDLQADCFAHAADLAVAALVQVISNTVRPGSSTTTWMTAGWVFTPSSSTTPLDILTTCSSVARGAQ